MASTLEELLLVLAGHPSSLFVIAQAESGLSGTHSEPWAWTMRAADDLPLSHPGERTLLDAVLDLAAKHRRIAVFATSLRDEARRQVVQAARERRQSGEGQSCMLTHLAARMLKLLKGFQQLVLDAESDIVRRSWDMVQGDAASVSLVNIRARLEEWHAPLRALDSLVSALLQGPPDVPPTALDPSIVGSARADPDAPPRCPRWSAGQLLDLLSYRAETGVGRVQACMSSLLRTAEEVWMQSLIAWMCRGETRIDMEFGIESMEDPIVEWIGTTDAAGESESLSASVLASSRLPKLATSHSQEEIGQHKTGWRFVQDALPSCVAADQDTSDAILYVGKALAKVRNHHRKTSATVAWHGKQSTRMPADLSSSHVKLLQSNEALPCSSPLGFRKVVQVIRDEVSEWMWRNILTPEVVMDAFDTLAGYFLHRKGLFATSLLEQLSALRKTKLLSARSASASVIRAADLELAIQRASLRSEAEDSTQLERCSVTMFPLRNVKRKEGDWKEASAMGAKEDGAVRFDDVAIGVPFTLNYHVHFPLDLILTPPELRAYSDLFSFLLALHAVRASLRDSWIDLSKAQRARRRFTGTNEGGENRQEERRRAQLLRMACGTAREGMWFLEAVGGHFQTDIIDVQYTKFLDQLQSLRPPDAAEEGPEVPSAPISVDGWRQKVGQTVRRVSSMRTLQEDESWNNADLRPASSTAPETLPRRLVRSSMARSTQGGSQLTQAQTASKAAQSNRDKQLGLNFATTRATHQAFLAYVLEGLLLTNAEACQCIWRILQTCLRFTALIDRWGGDVLPSLLTAAGSDRNAKVHDTPTDKSHGDILNERFASITEVTTVLQQHLDSFFAILSKCSASSIAHVGVPEPEESKNAKQRESQSAASRHLEQLLLRLDYNGFISRRFAETSSPSSTPRQG